MKLGTVIKIAIKSLYKSNVKCKNDHNGKKYTDMTFKTSEIKSLCKNDMSVKINALFKNSKICFLKFPYVFHSKFLI